jgi:asparagine synthase (glutamine-hydrolysing)
MCGIAGITFKKKFDVVKKEKFKVLVETFQQTRGPDDFNELKIDEKSYFFHNRLSIIDLEHAKQPMEDENGIIVFNGEIYNYESIKDNNISYCYKSDTEVLLKGFLKDNTDFLHKTNSMFGFGIYKKEDKSIILGRDRIGIKQIYYIDNDEVFAFASTIKPLVMFSNKELNKNNLWKFYQNRAFKAPETIFEDIKELESGSILEYDTLTNKIISNVKWWERDTPSNILQNEDEIIDELESLLHSSIKDRLVADVPIGAFVSGGVDSSMIAAIASQYNPELEIFTVSMNDKKYDESEYARAIANKYNLNYHEIVLTGNEFLNELDRWVDMQDDIVANPSSLPLNILAMKARDNGYKVMLAGEGADEILGGYASYSRFMMAKKLYKYLSFLKPISGILSATFTDSRKRFFMQNALSNPSFYGTALLFEPHIIYEMLNKRVEDTGIHELGYALDLDIRDRVANDLLTSNGDRATMNASIESRVPFLSHQLVNFTAKIDQSYFIHKGQTKYLLKKLAEKYIPYENIYRKKVGFEMPLSDWFKNELKDLFLELIETSVQKNIIDISVIENLYDMHTKGKIDASGKLFAFMTLELSYRRLVKI